MTKVDTFHCQLITPDAALLDTQASSVVLPAHDGEIGILRNRAPLLCKLGIGELRVTTTDGLGRFYVEGGFAHVADNEVTVLTPQALPAGQIDAAVVEKELAELHSRSAGPEQAAQFRLAQQRAAAKLRVAAKAGI